MKHLRLPALALGAILILACGTTTPQTPTPRHLRQSARQLNLANVHYIKGCYAQALVEYQQAHERYTAADYMEGVAHSLNGIANVFYRLDERTRAVSAYNDAIEAYGLISDQPGAVRAMCNKAAALIAENRLNEAESVLDRADSLAIKNRSVEALRQKTRAMLEMQRGDVTNAEIRLNKAIITAREGGSELLSSTLYTMGQLLLAGQNPSRAITYFEKSLLLDQSAGAYDDIAHDLEAIGKSHDHLEQPRQAAVHYKRSIKIYALLGNGDKVRELATLLENLGIVPGVEIQATLQWVNQWLAGNNEANLCR